VALLPRLEAAMDEGMIRLMDWGALCDARPVEWLGPDPFININTPEDFQRLSDLP
jgi:molybdopterin-guanine dinucleotide biosynthesis protein A